MVYAIYFHCNVNYTKAKRLFYKWKKVGWTCFINSLDNIVSTLVEVFIDSKGFDRQSHSLEDSKQGQLIRWEKSVIKTIQKSGALEPAGGQEDMVIDRRNSDFC